MPAPFLLALLKLLGPWLSPTSVFELAGAGLGVADGETVPAPPAGEAAAEAGEGKGEKGCCPPMPPPPLVGPPHIGGATKQSSASSPPSSRGTLPWIAAPWMAWRTRLPDSRSAEEGNSIDRPIFRAALLVLFK